MKRFFSILNDSPFYLILVCTIMIVVSKLIEKKLSDVSMGIQLLSFVLLLFTFQRFLNLRKK